MASQLRSDYGYYASPTPGRKEDKILTLLCALDNADTGELRAIELGKSAIPLTLTDGRLCLAGHWSESLLSLVRDGSIEGEELTKEQVKELTLTLE